MSFNGIALAAMAGSKKYTPDRGGRRAKGANVVRLPAGDWRDALLINEKGYPQRVLANAALALRRSDEWAGVLGFNEFTSAATARRAPPWERQRPDWVERPWADHDDLLAAEWLQKAGIGVGVEIAAQAVQAVAGERGFHPVRDYLDGLSWDGVCRLDRWLGEYLGVEMTSYARAVGRAFLISAVARIYRPGCKADCALVLEGPQGAGKSTALKRLAAPWFTDEIADFGSKDAAEQTIGVWMIEISELGAISRPEVARIKAFMSRSEDRFRPAYGRRVSAFPRQCVFAGTVNGDDYLRDESGGRRFWPVRVGKIDVDGLADARDQIWAEAVVRWKGHEPWWLSTPALRRAAEGEQAARYQGDPWDSLIAAFLARVGGQGELGSGLPTVSVDQVLSEVLQIDPGRRTQQDMTRVARSLKSQGWERFQHRVGDHREWRYRPVTTTDDSGDDR